MSDRFPGWKDETNVVHMVGLHTNTRILTECGRIIVRSSNVFEQVALFTPCYESPNCLECVAEWEPY